MKNVMESVRKDTIIIACKKRAKEILTIKKNLTFMQCLEIAANEMQYNSWYELRNIIKQKVLKEKNNKPIIYFNEWDLFLKNLFAEDYESIHFEVRENELGVRVRKYGLMDVIDHKLNVEFMMSLIKEINLDPYNYDWLSKENYNIQTMPVHGKELNKNYDIVVVKKDIQTPFSGYICISGVTGSGMNTTLKSYLSKELTFSEKLSNLGFNENHIKDIKRNWG